MVIIHRVHFCQLKQTVNVVDDNYRRIGSHKNVTVYSHLLRVDSRQ